MGARERGARSDAGLAVWTAARGCVDIIKPYSDNHADEDPTDDCTDSEDGSVFHLQGVDVRNRGIDRPLRWGPILRNDCVHPSSLFGRWRAEGEP